MEHQHTNGFWDNTLMVSETKLDGSFLTKQVLIETFIAPERFDRNQLDGRIFVNKYK